MGNTELEPSQAQLVKRSNSKSAILIDAVNQLRRIVAANVTTNTGTHHRLGHLPDQGWFCCCDRGKRCPQIAHVQALVPPMEPR